MRRRDTNGRGHGDARLKGTQAAAPVAIPDAALVTTWAAVVTAPSLSRPDASHAASAASPPRHLPITFRSAAAARLRAVRASSASIPARCRRSCRASATVGRAGRRLQAGGGGAPLVAAPPVTAGWPRLLGRRRGAEHQADAARQSRDAAPGPIRGCLPPLPQPALDRGRAALRRERRNAARRGGAPGSVLPPPR